MENQIDTCITGYGVICGAEVQVNPDCSVELLEGTLVFPDGSIVHTPKKLFRYYIQPDKIQKDLLKAILAFLDFPKNQDAKMEFFLLADETADPGIIDALKQQHPNDIPETNLMHNKILLALSLDDASGSRGIFFILVSRDALAKVKGIEIPAGSDNQGLFSRPIMRKEVDLVTIDEFLRPVLKLPVLTLPRFGYKTLAISLPSMGLIEENLHFPLAKVDNYAQIFFEYKSIVDDYIEEFRNALDLLHKYFGPVLSHKGNKYLSRYRKIPMLKLKMFYEEGEHLYYMQYFYDWLRDLTIAYNEIVLKLSIFKSGCPCQEISTVEGLKVSILMLGPVLGGRSTYQPLIFRELAEPGARDNDIRELRFLHWRMLMMIRTFDLPFLGLEKVLHDAGDEPGIEEKLDSSNYWEYFNSKLIDLAENEPNWLPIKFTPSGTSWGKLESMAIPYYYPLDSNSIYSLHQFWHYTATKLRHTDCLLSYNAYAGDPEKPSTDTVNDSYTNRIEVILPLAFNIEPYPCLRPEGYIGKRLTLTKDGAVINGFYFKSFGLFEYLDKYNICVDVIAIGLPGGEQDLSLNLLQGLEHRPVCSQGHSLVLFYVDSETEQIELTECTKDVRPEISQYTVVADFILPFRIECCTVPGVKYIPLVPQPVL